MHKVMCVNYCPLDAATYKFETLSWKKVSPSSARIHTVVHSLSCHTPHHKIKCREKFHSQNAHIYLSVCALLANLQAYSFIVNLWDACGVLCV